MGHVFWVKVADYQNAKNSILFFTPDFKNFKGKVELTFGVKKVNCLVHQLINTEASDLSESTFEKPSVLFISTALATALRIPTGLTYQLRLEKGNINIGPTIGLLLGTRVSNYTPEFMTEHYSDRMGVYSEMGGMVVAYSTAAVDWDRQIVEGLLYQPDDKTWAPVVTVLPKVTYRRHILQPNFRNFRRKVREAGGILFNSIRYSKWKVHIILSKNPIMAKFLPETILLNNFDQLLQFNERHSKVILKPKSGSRGRGILIIKKVFERGQERYIVSDSRKVKNLRDKVKYSREALRLLLNKRSVFNDKYICQQHVELATIQGAAFDIRILMQKHTDMIWHCSGIECRIAHPDKEITNLAAGGLAVSFEEAVSLMDSPVRKVRLHASVLRMCKEVCFWMDRQKNQHYAEFGLDVGVDKKGGVWLIEANFRPGYMGFKQLDYDLYLEICYNPLRYAVKLQKFVVI